MRSFQSMHEGAFETIAAHRGSQSFTISSTSSILPGKDHSPSTAALSLNWCLVWGSVRGECALVGEEPAYGFTLLAVACYEMYVFACEM
jgi:hypothetical protein